MSGSRPMRLLRDILLLYRRQIRQSLRVPMTLGLGLLMLVTTLVLYAAAHRLSGGRVMATS